MNQVTRENHYVPQGYLRRWADENQRVYTYRTLVPSAQVPVWTCRSLRGIAKQRDLYTQLHRGKEVDDFERWITAEFESPAFEVISKLARNARLRPSDWDVLVRFMIAQDVRTPLSFLESMERWEAEVPKMLDSTLREVVGRMEAAPTVQLRTPLTSTALSQCFRVKIEKDGSSATKPDARIRAEVLLGRKLWVSVVRHLLTETIEKVGRHRWAILTPAANTEWITSDHPVLRLNWYGSGRYDFKGGWGNPRTDLMMPLTPRHLMYTQVGSKDVQRAVLTHHQTKLIKRLLAERAHRFIFSRRPDADVSSWRPRIVDAAAVRHEAQQWRDWHDEQKRVEQEETPPASSV